MAKQTIDQLHTEIGVNGMTTKIIRSVDGTTTDQVLAVGGANAPGRTRWATITHSNSVTDQVAEIDAVLIDGY